MDGSRSFKGDLIFDSKFLKKEEEKSMADSWQYQAWIDGFPASLGSECCLKDSNIQRLVLCLSVHFMYGRPLSE